MARITKKKKQEVLTSVQSFLYSDKKRPVLPLIYKTKIKKTGTFCHCMVRTVCSVGTCEQKQSID